MGTSALHNQMKYQLYGDIFCSLTKYIICKIISRNVDMYGYCFSREDNKPGSKWKCYMVVARTSHYEFHDLLAATDSFSESNKFSRGGYWRTR